MATTGGVDFAGSDASLAFSTGVLAMGGEVGGGRPLREARALDGLRAGRVAGWMVLTG